MRPLHLRPGLRRLLRLPLSTTSAIHRDVDEELEALIAARTETLMSRGLTPDVARVEALRRLGADLGTVRASLHSSAEHRERRMRWHEHIESLIQDLRYAARGLARRPAFTAVAVVTLAIGIGATTAIFSAIDTLLLRRLPFARPDELMTVSLVTPRRGDRPPMDNMVWSYPKFVVFRDAQRVFTTLALYGSAQFSVRTGEIERVNGETVGAAYLRTLGLAPVRGRDFDLADDRIFNAPRDVILSYDFWNSRFNMDPSIIGRAIDVNGEPFAVIGVAPEGFRGLTGEAQLFIPITTAPASSFYPQGHSYWLVARRAPNVSMEAATAAAAVLGVRVNDAVPNPIDREKWGAKAQPLNTARVAPVVRQSVLVLFVAVVLVLLIACVNVANLLLGRAATREREIAVRLAIGAGRSRLVRLLVTESVLLALVGGVASIGVAWIGVSGLSMVDPATTLHVSNDRGLGAMDFATITLDWTALGFAFGVSTIVGVLFGLIPALVATRPSLAGTLRNERSSVGRSRGGPSGILVMTELALALMLLAGSGLMLRSLSRLLRTDVGFDGTNVLTARVTASGPRFGRDSLPGLYLQLIDRLRAIPGVAEAAIGNCAPLSGGCNTTSIEFPEHPEVDLAHSPTITADWATPGWFSVLRIPLKRGRMFTTSDRLGTPDVVLVNETAARQFWPGQDPIGKRVSIGQGFPGGTTVIGVVGDVRQHPDSQPMPGVYIPYLGSPNSRMIIFIRASSQVAGLAASVRQAVHDVAPTLPVYDMQTMSARTAAASARSRFSALVLTLFAATALALAAVGMYGVMSLAVTARTREIGIRIALGAERSRVERLVVGRAAVFVAVGTVAGLAGALAATRALKALLFDVSPWDPPTYVGMVVVLAAIALTASWLPARRAARVDPLVALRSE